MYKISNPFNSICETPRTEISNICLVDLKIDQNEDQNDYRTFFETENFEKYIESYPKTKVEVRVLGYVPIPD